MLDNLFPNSGPFWAYNEGSCCRLNFSRLDDDDDDDCIVLR